jgi:hypothetical protein
MKRNEAGVSREWLLRGSDGHEIELSLEPTRPLSVGRDLSADVAILDAGASRHHALISLEDGSLWIEDLHSQNGTFVNGERVQRAALGEGDIITVGRVHLTLLPRERRLALDSGVLRRLSRDDRIRLVELARELLALPDPAAGCRRWIERACAATVADRGAVLSWDGRDRRFLAVASEPQESPLAELSGHCRLLALAALENAAAVVHQPAGRGVHDRARLASPDFPAAAAPLFMAGRPAGALLVDRHLSGRPFEQHELDLLSAHAWLSEGAFSASRQLLDLRDSNQTLERRWRESSREIERLREALAPAREAPGLPGAGSSRHGGLTAAPPAALDEALGALDGQLASARHKLERLLDDASRSAGRDPRLRSRLGGELARLERTSRALRLIGCPEPAAPKLVEARRLAQQVLGGCGVEPERWNLESGEPVHLAVDVEALELVLELLADAALSAGAAGGFQLSLRAGSGLLHLGFQAAPGGPEEESDRDINALVAVAGLLAATKLSGRLTADAAAGRFELELPEGHASLEETVAL